MAKKQRDKPTLRNPVAPALRDPKFRKKIAKSDEERADQRDPWSKNAKHKKQNLDEFYQVGDKIEVISGPLKAVLDRAEKLRKKNKEGDKVEKPYHTKDGEAIVRNADGPMGSLGITIDGEYHLVDPEDVKLLYETFADLHEWSYAETTAGFRIPISSEENDVLKMCADRLYKRNLDDREKEVARRMVSRGVLKRGKDDEGVFFTGPAEKLKRF